LALLGVAGATFVVQAGLLEGYQQDRLTTFLDLEHDVRGASYNQHQSVTAVGSGGVWGQGLFDGPQTQLRFVPEQETDFIFTVVGEELGFAGSLLVLGLFALVLVRIHAVARSAQDDFGALLCVGVLVMLAFQLFQNVGMNLGILPVTGIPLPLLSYGGSSLLTVLTSLGLTSSVAAQRYRGSPF
jgi:rod shape determining protein RodA